MPDPQSIGIAVITSYPKWYKGPLRSIKHTDKVRGDLALEFFRETSKRGYTVVCSDAHSSKSFLKSLQMVPHIQVIKRTITASGRSKRDVVRRLAKMDKIKIIVATEAEKVSIITDCLEGMIKPLLEDKADIVVPKRDNELFKTTYPDYMYKSEMEGNRIYNEALRSNGIMNEKQPDFDHFFGPRAFVNDPKVISLFMKHYVFTGQSIISSFFDPDKYSNFIYFPVVNALKKKLRVAGATVPFRYPVIQKENEEVGDREAFLNKRNLQRVGILTDLMHFLSLLEKKRSSKLRSV